MVSTESQRIMCYRVTADVSVYLQTGSDGLKISATKNVKNKGNVWIKTAPEEKIFTLYCKLL